MSRAQEALERIRDYFDQRADAEYHGDGGPPVPNTAMNLLRDVDEVAAAIRALAAEREARP